MPRAQLADLERKSGKILLRLGSGAVDKPRPFWYRSAFLAVRRRSKRLEISSPQVGGFVLVQIFVRENNVDQALKALKKKMQREGTFREMKRRSYFEKPSEKRAREAAEAVRRTRKLARKRAQREGLIAGPVRKPRGA